MAFHKIVVAGASGNLGAPILRNLLTSEDHVFEVTVLTRSKTTKAESFISAAGLPPLFSNKPSVVSVEYNDHTGLVRALTGADVLIAVLAGTVAIQVDPLLLLAAQEAGVRRFPSQFTLDVLHPAAQALFLDRWPNAFPVMAAKQYEALEKAGGATSYTCILTSMFLDVFLETALFGAYDIRGRKATLVDDGAAFFTACSTDFIAAAVVAVLKMPEEVTKTMRIPIAEVRSTGTELVKTIQEVFGITMDVQHKSSEQIMIERANALAMGDLRTAYGRTVEKLAGDGSGPGDLIDGLMFDADRALTFDRRTLKELVLHVKQRIQKA